MILQALTQLYEDLVARGKIARPGWNPARISYALCLSEAGALEQVIPLFTEEQAGKKTVLRPQPMELPAPVKRTAGVVPNFLWDNSNYILGIDNKGNPQRSKECFRACGQLHHQLLDAVDSPAARAILAWFDTWQPELAQKSPPLVSCWDDLMKSANLVFRIQGEYAQKDPAIQAAWNAYYNQSSGNKTQCLVTGAPDVAEPVHPSIKGVAGAQSSGAAIVSFNAPAFCSYGKEQSLNAPVGKYAAFAYTSALNHLLSDRDNVYRIGDTTVVCWAAGAEPNSRKFFGASIFGAKLPEQIATDTLRATVKKLANNQPCPELDLDPRRPF